MYFSINNHYEYLHYKGDVAQLARALDWQSRGRGFESHLLHINRIRVSDIFTTLNPLEEEI